MGLVTVWRAPIPPTLSVDLNHVIVKYSWRVQFFTHSITVGEVFDILNGELQAAGLICLTADICN